MSYELFECIDLGSEFCPCHLAETNQCLICNNLNKQCQECHCPNWKGVCVYQELSWNNFKAKDGRKYFKCKVIKKEILHDKILFLDILVDDYLIKELNKIGSFVFLRRDCDKAFFDTPISIMSINNLNKTISVAIELKGSKTENLSKVNINGTLLVKGPFWNGVLGRRHVLSLENSKALLICRGIGQAPLVPILKYLKEQNNEVTVLIDLCNEDQSLIQEYLEKYAAFVYFVNTLEKGKLKENFSEFLNELLLKDSPSTVYCSGADILNYEIMCAIDKVNIEKNIKEKINYSCSNNAKMCCGEGLCGACTLKNNDHKLRHLCKMQTDPQYILKGRRLI